MIRLGPGDGIRWRKDGGNEISSQPDALEYVFDRPIQSSDEGIYEIYYDGERREARGALIRLIVRGIQSITIVYGLSFSAFARFPEFPGTINDSFSSTCANTAAFNQLQRNLSANGVPGL